MLCYPLIYLWYRVHLLFPRQLLQLFKMFTEYLQMLTWFLCAVSLSGVKMSLSNES